VVTGISDLTNNENHFYLYPNPADEHVNISLQLDHPSDVQIEVFNSVGQRMTGSVDKTQGGTYKTTVNTSEFAPGAYLVKISLGDKVLCKNFIKK
jgi:hypothetical protein